MSAVPASSHQQLVHTVVIRCPQQYVWQPTVHVDVNWPEGLHRFPFTTSDEVYRNPSIISGLCGETMTLASHGSHPWSV